MRSLILIITLVISQLFPFKIQENCDLIEINHVYSYQAEINFTQIIFWKWNFELNDYIVKHWKIIDYSKSKEFASEEVDIYKTDVYNVTWYDKIEKCYRIITSKQLKESWTQKDRERENQKILHQDLRVGLAMRVLKKK